MDRASMSSGTKKESEQYLEIANDIQINTLQSKIQINVPAVAHFHKPDHVLHQLKEEESLVLPSPVS